MAGQQDPEPSLTKSPTVPAEEDDLGSMASFLRAAAAAPSVARPSAVGRTLDRYEVMAVIGQGGMGIVYEARDRKLDRVVALKCLPGERIGDEQRQRRFLREALVTAGLEHPGIVPVYDAGESAGELYYAMKKVSGQPLLALIERARDVTERLALLPHVRAVSEAVAFAHRHGIIHRDLKPENVLVGELGETVVVDWGLAKRIGRSRTVPSGRFPPIAPASEVGATEVPSGEIPRTGEIEPATRAGDVLGTPGYMPPEQAQGQAIDARADVYALGAILGHVLTGVPPGQPQPAAVLDELGDRVPDLMTLIGKAMATDPAARYTTAEELAEELRRFEAGKLVGAHQYSTGALVRRWLARHRAMVAVVTTMVTLLSVVSVLSVRRIVDERDGANAARTAAETARGQAEARQRELILIQARDGLDRDPTASLAWLKTYPHSAASLPDERAIAADAWARGVASHVIHRDPFVWVSVFPDGRRIAATNTRSELLVIDSATGEVRVLHADDGLGLTLRISDDGHHALTVDGRGSVRLWDLDAGTSHRLDGACHATSEAFSPDGAFVLAWSGTGGACLWEMATGKRRDLPAGTIAAAFLPDRPALAVARERQLELLDLTTEKLSPLLKLDARPGQVVTSGDGHWISVTTADHATLLDRRNNAQVILRADEGTGGVRLSRDGRWAAMCGLQSGTIWVFDLVRGGGPRPFPGQGCLRRGMVFAPDGTLVTMTSGAGVNLLDLVAGTQHPIPAHQGPIVDVDVSADGKLLASVSADGVLRTYRLGEGDVRVFPGLTSPAAVAADGTVLLRDAADGRLALGNVSGAISAPISGPRPLFWPQMGSLSLDGRRAVFPEADLRFTVYDAADGHRTTLTPYAGLDTHHTTDALSPDGTLLALASGDRAIRLVDVRTGAVRVLGSHADAPTAVTFSWNGRLLASTGRDGALRLWDVASGTALQTFTGHSSFVFDAMFSRDDTRIVTASTDGTARVWDIASGRAVVLDAHRGSLDSADFAADGHAVVTAGVDGVLTWWDLATVRPMVLRREPAELGFVRFSADGKLLLVGGGRHVRILDPSVPHVPDDPKGFAAWLAKITTAEVDPQGQLASPRAAGRRDR